VRFDSTVVTAQLVGVVTTPKVDLVLAAPQLQAVLCVLALLYARAVSKGISCYQTNVFNARMFLETVSIALTLQFALVVNQGISWMQVATVTQ
jgi:hypothetical protein